MLLALVPFGGPERPETFPGHSLDCRIALADGSTATLAGSTGTGVRDRAVLRGGGTMYAYLFPEHETRYRSGDQSLTPRIVGSQEGGASLFLYFDLPDHQNMHVYIEAARPSGEATLRAQTQGPELHGNCRVAPPLAVLPEYLENSR